MYARFLKGVVVPATASMMYAYGQFKTNLAGTDPVIKTQPKLSSYRPNDYLHMHYAAGAYYEINDYQKAFEKDKWKIEEGWQVLDFHKAANGYFGVAYLNPRHKHIIVAHRGTEDLKDLVVDLDAMTRHLNEQEPTAWNDFAKKIIERHGPEYTYSFTGHSLGGWLAQTSLWKYQDEFVRNNENKQLGYQEAFAVTMDEPGAREMLEALQPRGSDYKINVDNLDITNYLSYPNIVNTISGHVGTVYGLSPELKLSWLQNKTLSYSINAHSSTGLLKEFAKESGLAKECVRVLDWPRVLWGPKLSSAKHSKGTMGYAWHMLKSYVKGEIERSEYLAFYTYTQNEVKINEPPILSSNKQFQLKHGIHYRIEKFNPQVLPLRNMPRQVRGFLQDLSSMPDRAKALNELIPDRSRIEDEIMVLLNAYTINDDTAELILDNTKTKIDASAFRDKIVGFLIANETLYQNKLAVLQTAALSSMIEQIKAGATTDIFAQLQTQSQNTLKILNNLSLKQGTARLYKFIKPSLDEVEELAAELVALKEQIELIEMAKLRLEAANLKPKVVTQLQAKLQDQEQQLTMATQITSALLMYMQNKPNNADKELDALLAFLNSNKYNLPDLDKDLLLNRAYNLKAKIAAVNGDRELSAKHYSTATKILADDAITWSNFGGLLTDSGRAQNPQLHAQAYSCYQQAYTHLAQITQKQIPMVCSGIAYGFIMLAQCIEQGQIEDAQLKKLPSVNHLHSQAQALLKRAIEVNSNYLNARLFAALLAYEQKNYPQALQEINNVLTMNAMYPTALMRKGFILEKLEQASEALEYLRLAKERLEATQRNGENASWIREVDEKMVEISQKQQSKLRLGKI